MSTSPGKCCAPYGGAARLRPLMGAAAGLALLLGAESVGGQPATQPAGSIANTAQAVAETPPDTVITHRQSPRQARSGPEEEGGILPARSTVRGKSLWFGDGWYVTGLVSLTAVLGLIFLLSYLARRFVLPGARLGSRELEVLARTYVGNKQSIALVKAGGRLMVVGATANRISLLTCLDEPGEAAELLGRLAAGKPGSLSSQFGQRLEDESERFEEARFGELPYGDERPEFARRTRRQLRAVIDRVRGVGRQGSAGPAVLAGGQTGVEQRAAG